MQGAGREAIRRQKGLSSALCSGTNPARFFPFGPFSPEGQFFQITSRLAFELPLTFARDGKAGYEGLVVPAAPFTRCLPVGREWSLLNLS